MNQVQQVANQKRFGFADQSLAKICERSSVVKRVLDNFGHVSLDDYLSQVLKASNDPLQPRNDLIEVVFRYAESLLGQSVAETVAVELETFPVVLTANHHGVDFLAQSLQSSLMFSLRKVNGKPAKTVPVFACGNIALNNPTYPRGILVYQADAKSQKFALPIRLPVFPDRCKRKAVSVAEPYNLEMLARTEKNLALMTQNKQLAASLASVVKTILDEDYRNPSVIQLMTYSQQAVVLNNRIWNRCFQISEQSTEMVCLELEKIASLLLQIDLKHEDSLAWQILFNPTLRTQVLNELNGVRACWNLGKLDRRFCIPSQVSDNHTRCGTTFFWAVNADACRVPLSLGGCEHGATLQGIDDKGKVWTFPFRPQDVLDNLKTGRLLPSLFTCYSTIGFARGVSCCGGYFQAEYLSVIQSGLVSALRGSEGCMRIVEQLSGVPSDIYLSGMQTVVHNFDDDVLLPAGPVEIIAGGGLSRQQLQKIRALILHDIHLAGLIESLPDFQRLEERPENWCLLLANENNFLLKDRAVLI